MNLRHLLGAIAGAVGLAALTLPASAGCLYVEAGVGGTMAKDNISSTVDLSQSGALASLGLFCRIVGPSHTGFYLDFGGRGDIEHSSGDLGSQSLTSDYMVEALARLGYRYHEKIEVYAQAGAAWTDLKLPGGLGTKQPFNWELGAGIKTHVTGNWWIGLEGDYLIGDKQDVGSFTTIAQDTLAARATLTYYFSEPLNSYRSSMK